MMMSCPVRYLYYFLMSVKKVPKWFPPSIITVAQILQMVVGVFVAYNYYAVLSSGGHCAVNTDLLLACAVMYSTYLYLFVEFAVKRYIFPMMGWTKKGGAKEHDA
jgi:hypothetical protein